MRRNIQRYAIMAVCAVLGACTSEIEDNFKESASERLAQRVEQYDALLQSAPYGWIMNYYPSDGSLGGCVYTAKFDKGNVELASELRISDEVEVGTPVTSKYRVLAEQGVILSFDTYNELLHYFSEPRMSDIDGYQSDYEFVFMRTSEQQDSIFLRGKRYGTELTMIRATAEDADYIERVIQMNRDLMAVPHFRMTVDGTDYPIRLNDLELIYNTDGAEQSATFIYTPYGIDFYQPLTVGGVTFQSLLYDEASGELRSADGRVVIHYPTNMQQLVNTFGQWLFVVDAKSGTGDMDPTFCAAFHRPVQFLCTVEQAFIGRNLVYPDRDPNEYVIGFRYNVFDQYLLYGCYGVQLTPLADDLLQITGVEAAYGYNNYYFSPIVNRIFEGSPYRVEFQPGRVQKKIRLVSQADDDNWFVLTSE